MSQKKAKSYVPIFNNLPFRYLLLIIATFKAEPVSNQPLRGPTLQPSGHEVEILAGRLIWLVAVGIVSLMLGAACQSGYAGPAAGTPSEALTEEYVPALQDFPGIDKFKGVFNREAGQPRVVLLLSPT